MIMKTLVIFILFFTSFFPGMFRPALRPAPEVSDSLRYVFVGSEACASKCHNSSESGHQLDKWRNSGHAEAFAVLSSPTARSYAGRAGLTSIPQESQLCLKCHSTAAGCDPSSVGSTFSAVDGVGCEACHKGEFRPQTWIPGEADCRICHNSELHEVPEFVYGKALVLIAHPMPGADSLQDK